MSQNADRAEVLRAIHDYFGCGSIRPDPGDKTLKWEVRALRSLRSSVLPHFERWPLLSGKHGDFIIMKSICDAMAMGRHLQRKGLRSIVEMAAGMNPSGRRRYDPKEIIEQLAR